MKHNLVNSRESTFDGCVMFYNFVLIVSSPKSGRAFWKLLLSSDRS
ncbi:MAG: hypothetical protein ACTS45_00635 [Candidatus Hodgkinia cicadicola]